MKKIIVTMWACAIFAIGALAQTVDLQFAPTELKQVGPSPQAAAMTRYADMPVSYSLGIVQVSIPLYEIKSRSLTLPLSLSYNSSGVRVDEVSGPAGLNWNLEAGGVITRTVIGLPDETAAPGDCVQPAPGANPSASEPGQMLNSDYNYLKSVSEGNADREWDLYSYRFGNYSGSFYMIRAPYSGEKQIVPTSATDLDIQYLGTGFLIRDPSGTSWIFTQTETTSRFIEATSPGLNAGGSSAEMTAQNSNTVTAWYLTRIQSVDGKDAVTFSYDTLGTLLNDRRSNSRTYSFTYRYLSPGTYQWLDSYGRWLGPPVAIQNMEASYLTELGWTPKVVKTITYAGGHVTFYYADDPRAGASSVRNSYPAVLSSMRVYADGDTTAVRVAAFSVKENQTGDQRNLLKEVTISGKGGNLIESYELSYINEGTSMIATAKDLFGYYNAKSSNQSTSFLRLFEDIYTINETAADRSYNADAVSDLSLETIKTASGSKTKFFYEGNSIPTNGASQLFSHIGIGHRIRKIQTFDPSTGTETLVREREFTYSGQGITIPLTAFNRGSFSSVNETFREDLVVGHPWWTGPTNSIPRTATVCLSDQGMLCGAPLEGARIFYSTVTERTYDPSGNGGSIRTDYVYDCSNAVATYSNGAWSLGQAHDEHDDSSLNNMLGSHLYHFFQRPPYMVPRVSDGPSVDFSPFWFHFVDRDHPEFGEPVEVRRYKTSGAVETLVSRTVNEYETAYDNVQSGLRVKNLIALGNENNVRGYRFCALDFFLEEVYRTRVYRRLKSTTQTEYLDDEQTEKSVRTDYYYEPGTRLSMTSATNYPSAVHTTPAAIPAVGSILSPRLTVQMIDNDASRRYARYSIFADELSGLPGYGWADALLAAGYRAAVGEEVLVGGTIPSAPASKSGRYVTWASFTPADTGSGSILKPSKIEIWRKEAGSGTNFKNVGPTVQYLAYDHWGNPLEIQTLDPQNTSDQKTVTYIWSYSGLRPVAEITGASYAQAAQKIGSNVLTAIASAASGPSDYQLVQIRMGMSQLSAAQYSLYTYDLPFGVKWTEDVSRRKTSYEYDGAGRLKAVKGDDGFLMEGYLYELTRGTNGNPNRITSLSYTASGQTVVPTSFANAMSMSNAIKEVTYLDGLGRSRQGVSVGASTGGKDLVTPFVPDFLDHEDAKVYLPYPSSGSTGAYRNGAQSAQQSYYTGLYGSNEGARAYSENVYERSARNRVTAISLPGFTEQTTLSTKGSLGGHMPVLTFNPSAQTISASGYYNKGYFTVSVTTGPDGSRTESWTDQFGTPVLERVRIREAASGQSEEWAETRYVKDVRGRVVCIIPPAEYALLLNAAGNNGFLSSFSAEHCYTYAYDERDRVVKRHLPDQATESLYYNNADLVTKTSRIASDGIGTEIFSTVYDAFYRPTVETYQYGSGAAVTLAKYSYDTTPTTISIGGYVLPVPTFSAVSGVVEASDKDTRMKGLKTAEIVRVISPGETPSTMVADASAQYIVRSFHYDKKGNIIQTAEYRPDIASGTTDIRSSVKYGFAGNVLLSGESITPPSGGSVFRLNKAYSYDARLRQTDASAQLTSGGIAGPQGVLHYTYDDLGRTASVERNNNTSETTSFSYTLQGWLQGASSPDYEETLRYASPAMSATSALPGKAGLITEWVTRQKGTTASGGVSAADTYAYSYDNAGRLTGSIRYSGSSTSPLTTLTEKDITYDPSGNLLTLKRYGSSSGTTPTDNLSFSYTGAKRTGYSYDAHGNVTADPTNGTSILWNVIDLPKSISDGTDSARRVYAADGTLLAVYEGSTGTMGRVYAGSMVMTRNASNVLTMESAGWEGGRILPGTGADKLIYQIADHLGSIRVIKDGNGDVLQRFDYYPFGSESKVWTAGTSTPQSALRYRFGGKEIAGQSFGASALAGIPAAAAGSPYLDFGARLYDPRTAAWLSQDPMAEKYYSISPYAYCAGNPVNLVDPEGTDWYYLHQDGTIALGFEDKEDRDNDYLSLGYWETSSVGPLLFLRVPKAVNLGGLSQVNSSDNLSHAISSSDESIIDLFDFVIHHSANREWAIASFNGENGSRVYGLVQGKKGSSVMSPSEIDGLEESRMVAKIHTHEGYIEEHGASGDYREPLPYVITDRWNYKNMLERSKLYNFPMPDHYVYEVPFKVLYQYNERKGDIYKGKYKTGMFKQVLK